MSQLVNKIYRRGPLGWLRDLLLKEQERGGFSVIATLCTLRNHLEALWDLQLNIVAQHHREL